MSASEGRFRSKGAGRRLTVCALLWALSAPSAMAAPEKPPPAPDIRLKQLEQEMKKGEAEHEQIREKAASLAHELADIKSDMVTAARAVQGHEDTLSDLESQLGDLASLEQEKLAALDLKRQQLNGVLTALQRLAFRPSEALIAQPTSPADTVRSAILLRDVVPKIKDEATSLRAEIDSLSSLREDIAKQQQRIAAATTKLDAEHRRLATLFKRKERIQHDTEDRRVEAEKRLASMASEASDLRDLLTRIEEEKKRAEAEAKKRAEAEKAAARAAREAQIAAQKAARQAELAAKRAAKEKREAELAQLREARAAEIRAKEAAETAQANADRAERNVKTPESASFSHAHGDMPFPARGRIVVKYGQNDATGQPSRGITISTRPDAQVVAPFDGQVVFAGQFRGYGLLLIIEHSEGYHTLLAGMARIDGVVGQHLAAGEPVGVMGQSESKPLLYVELRHDGQPVNPLPWLTARKTRVSG